MNSTPSIFEFVPEIPWQRRMVHDIFHEYDYSLGTHVIVCSGSIGSGKSLPAAHIAVRHCLENDGARFMLGRKALPDLKDTIYKKVVEHIECDELVDGKDYWRTDNIARIMFRNGSEIISRSWADRKFKKLGSLELSGAIIEELSENDADDEKAFEYVKMRVGRLPHIKQNVLICLTNPDEPDTWQYKKLISKPSNTIHVYYSKLSENPFLPEHYESNLRENMDPLMARRMLDGEWISILGQGVYYAYSDKNKINESYKPDPRHPVCFSWDFNIAENKPLSVAVMQYINGTAHIYNEIVIDGMRTEESCEELADRGFLTDEFRYELCGDATGRHRDTRNRLDDWSIIKKFFSNYKTKTGRPLRWSSLVPTSNPPVRERHNIVNAHCCNANGEIRLFVYKDAPTADAGLRMTKLKKGGQYVEDDSKREQHISTAIGYCIHRKKQGDGPPAPQFL